MKRCPKCNLNYSDETLEFCLEDGTRLLFSNTFESDTPTITRSQNPNPTIAKTVNFPISPQHNGITNQSIEPAPQTLPRAGRLKEGVIQKGNRVLEIAPIIFALAHNWWQWIYLNNLSYSTFAAYFFSVNFLMWLLLLMLGIAAGLLGLKRAQNRDFTIAGLVVLAINLILFLVPKR